MKSAQDNNYTSISILFLKSNSKGNWKSFGKKKSGFLLQPQVYMNAYRHRTPKAGILLVILEEALQVSKGICIHDIHCHVFLHDPGSRRPSCPNYLRLKHLLEHFLECHRPRRQGLPNQYLLSFIMCQVPCWAQEHQMDGSQSLSSRTEVDL